MSKRAYSHLYDQNERSASPSLPASTTYAKAIITVADLLSNYDLRTGDYLMLAETSEVAMHLNRGTLSLDMPHHIYQRSGLTFPVTKSQSGGRKHEKGSARYRLTIDLRAPSMVRGKKGFDRLMYAAKNVDGLREGRVWLFVDLGMYETTKGGRKRKRDDEGGTMGADEGGEQRHPLAKYHPTIVNLEGKAHEQMHVLVPAVISRYDYLSTLPAQIAKSKSKGGLPTILEDNIYEVTEYLSMLFLQSTRVSEHEYGKIDRGICAYDFPTTSNISKSASEGDVEQPERSATDGGQDGIKVEDMVRFQYAGLVPSDFVVQLVVDLIRRSRKAKVGGHNEKSVAAEDWVAINVRLHRREAKGGVDGYIILLHSDSGARISKVSSSEYAVEGPQRPGAGQMDLDEPGREGEQGKSCNQVSSTGSGTGLRYVTCFEFVDSGVQ